MARFIPLTALAAGALASVVLPRQSDSNTAYVDFSQNTGTPQHLAAGFIYGIPGGFPGMSANQIPSHFYSGMGFNYARVGGAQMTQGGWIDGISNYEARFQNSLSDYHVSRGFDASVILLPHDIWGTDHSNSSTVWPGDNGDWTNYDQFLNQLLSDIKSNNMVNGLVYDIWNEPDGGFWQRSQAQYLAMWNRTYHRIRSDSTLNGMQISGPSSAGQPSGSWFNTWMQYVTENNVIPDQYSWHDEPGDPQTGYNSLQSLLQQYGAPQKLININEYATFSQQCSAGAAWFISRLERINARGLRGNWLSGCQLHDFMASLVTKSDLNSCGAANYSPNGEWWTYNYYSQNMTGYRVQTTGTTDSNMDIYATVGTDKVRILTGVINSQTGTWYITLKNLGALGLPESGTLEIFTWGLIDDGHNGAVTGPTNRGTYGHPYSGGTVTFPIYQTQQDLNTAWAFEFSP